jgi:hypothetical protein
MTEPTDVGPDRDLGRRLRSLPVPDHGDEFFDRLRGRLAAESAFTGAPSYRGRSARVIELSAARPQPVRRPPSRARRLVTLATAPAAAVACFALVVGGAVVVHRPGDRGTPRPIESGTRWSADNRTVDRPDRADRLTAAAPYESTERGLAIAFTTRASSRAGLVQSSYQATVTPSATTGCCGRRRGWRRRTRRSTAPAGSRGPPARAPHRSSSSRTCRSGRRTGRRSRRRTGSSAATSRPPSAPSPSSSPAGSAAAS